jgi:hypothetical protein
VADDHALNDAQRFGCALKKNLRKEKTKTIQRKRLSPEGYLYVPDCGELRSQSVHNIQLNG